MFRPQELTIGFDKGFSSNIMYPDVFLVPGAMPQIYCPITKGARSIDLSGGSIRRYYLKERYTKHILLDLKVVQGPIRRWWNGLDLFERPIVLEGVIREGDCQQR